MRPGALLAMSKLIRATANPDPGERLQRRQLDPSSPFSARCVDLTWIGKGPTSVPLTADRT